MTDRVIGYLRTTRVDGLCDRCWLPSLFRCTVTLLLPGGVSQRDRGVKCVHCDQDRA